MDELETSVKPKWLDDELLKTCIAQSLNISPTADIDILDVVVNYAVPKGENYMSVIYRVFVNFCVVNGNKSNAIKKESFICKVSHESEEMQKFAKEIEVFQKEAHMYTKMVPDLTKTLRSAGISGQIACRCLHSVEGERDVLMIEDLKPKGYVVADRVRGLDLQHCKLVLDKLAKLHASSMHVYKSQEIPAAYRRVPLDIDIDALMGDMKEAYKSSILEKVTSVVSELEKYSHYAKQIDFFKRVDQIKEVDKVWKVVPGNKFNAILHGDCWVNNMMFQYDADGSVQDVLLIDLQMSYWSTIGNDFTYFFFSSSNQEVRRNHFRDLQEFYIDKLTKYLKMLGYTGEIPTLAEFEIELKRVGFLAINMIVNFSTIMMNELNADQKSRDKSEAFDMKEMMEIINMPSRNYFDRFLASVDVLEEDGFFDEMIKVAN